jgi:thiol-disulfide isomerase/thioredoxin
MKIALLAFAPVLMAQSISGPWQGTVTSNGLDIPFRFEIEGSGSNVKGTFFNGDERYTSTSGTFEGGALNLKWEYFAATLDAKVENGAIDGTYSRARSKPMHFHAVKPAGKTFSVLGIPSIEGLWIAEGVKSSKGESAWYFIVKQNRLEASAAILRVDGDTGTLTGWLDGSKFVLSHFSGMRPAVLEVTANPDGSLKLLLDGKEEMTAYRPDVARAKSLPEPADPTQHTGVKDASQPFHFSFPDLNGKTVADSDPRFAGKVVLVNISGSWCPNCHDEAPFLEEMYKKYRGKGLEIVSLSFEEADQLKDPTRLRAFIKRYGIEYTVLLGGDTSEAKDKLSQATNWDAWPTTFFVGRDGRVRSVHAGFPSKASGELYTKAKEEFTAKVEKLLAESALSLR